MCLGVCTKHGESTFLGSALEGIRSRWHKADRILIIVGPAGSGMHDHAKRVIEAAGMVEATGVRLLVQVAQ